MEEFFIGGFIGVVLAVTIISVVDLREQGRVSVASGQYSCELEERADKTTKWVCERVK